MEGKLNTNRLSKVLDHRVPPEQLQCSLAFTLQISELYWRDGHHPLKDIPSGGVLIVVVETLSNTSIQNPP